MATAQLIDLSNFDDLLVLSTQSRSGMPDGNIFLDYENGRCEIITVQELESIDLGNGLEANPLTNSLGIKVEALHAFELKMRQENESLRGFYQMFSRKFKTDGGGGTYEVVNGRALDDAGGTNTSTTRDDRFKIKYSGWTERNADGAISSVYGYVDFSNMESELWQQHN